MHRMPWGELLPQQRQQARPAWPRGCIAMPQKWCSPVFCADTSMRVRARVCFCLCAHAQTRSHAHSKPCAFHGGWRVVMLPLPRTPVPCPAAGAPGPRQAAGHKAPTSLRARRRVPDPARAPAPCPGAPAALPTGQCRLWPGQRHAVHAAPWPCGAPAGSRLGPERAAVAPDALRAAAAPAAGTRRGRCTARPGRRHAATAAAAFPER